MARCSETVLDKRWPTARLTPATGHLPPNPPPATGHRPPPPTPDRRHRRRHVAVITGGAGHGHQAPSPATGQWPPATPPPIPPATGHRPPPPATDTGQRDRRNRRRHVAVIIGGVTQQPHVYSRHLRTSLVGHVVHHKRAPPPSHFAGRPSCPSQPHVPLPPASLTFPWPVLAMLMATCPSSASSAISSRIRLRSLLSTAACLDGPCRWICGFRPPPCCSHRPRAICSGTAVVVCKKVRGKKEEFATGHDRAVLSCLAALASPGADCDAKAQLALRHGGLGFRIAVRHASAAYWASWADCLPLFALCEPAFAERLSASLAGSNSLPFALDYLRLAGHSLSAARYKLSAWQNLSCMLSPKQHDDDQASTSLVAGPYAARVLTARPTSPELCLPWPFFPVLHLRRLRMQLPLAPAVCRSRRGLDVLTDHVAACPHSEGLRSRGGPFKRAEARVCREASSRCPAACLPSGLERRAWAARRAPARANRLPPLEWSPRRSPPLVLRAASSSALQGQASRFVLGIKVGGRWSSEAATFVRLLARCRARALPALFARSVHLRPRPSCPS